MTSFTWTLWERKSPRASYGGVNHSIGAQKSTWSILKPTRCWPALSICVRFRRKLLDEVTTRLDNIAHQLREHLIRVVGSKALSLLWEGEGWVRVER